MKSQAQDPNLILPIELWRECWKNLERDDLWKIYGTCHLFNDICRPLLFHRLDCKTKIKFGAKSNVRNRSAWCKAFEDSAVALKYFAESRKHTHLFRHCNYNIGLSHHQRNSIKQTKKLREAYESYILTFSTILPLFTQLRSIRFRLFTDVDKRFANALVKLPHLEEVHFESCRLNWFGFPPMMHLKTLDVSDEQDQYDPNEECDALDVFSIQKLEKLTTQSFIYTDKILLGLFRQGVCEHLTHLTIRTSPSSYGILRDFLARCPVLDTLSVEGWTYEENSDPLQPLPGSSAPLLRKYEGPGEVAKAIVPEHPIKVVQISDLWSQLDFSEEPLHVLRELTKSSSPVTNLVLPHLKCQPEIMTAVATMFPRLVGLQLTLVDDGAVPFRTSPEHHESAFPSAEDEDESEGESEDPANNNLSSDGGTPSQEGESPPGETGPKPPDGGLPDDGPSQPSTEGGEPGEEDERKDGIWVHIIPVDENDCPSRSPTSYPGLLDHLAFGKLPLPQDLSLLYLYRDPSHLVAPSTEAMKASEQESLLVQAKLVGMFKKILPSLTKVVLGEERPSYYWLKMNNNPEEPWSLIYRHRFPCGSFEDHIVNLD